MAEELENQNQQEPQTPVPPDSALPSVVAANQQPTGATGMSEGPDGKMYFHDIAGKQLGLAPENIQQDDTPSANSPASDKPLFDMSKAQPIEVKPLFDMSKAQPINISAKPFDMSGAQPIEKPGWFQENVVAPLSNAATRIKESILANEGPGWLPYDIAQHFKPETPPPPPATDEEALARLKARNASTAPDQIENEKRDINRRRVDAQYEQRNAKQYAEGGTRLISPEKLLTPDEAKESPYLYGLARAAGMLTTQENLEIMAGSQGLGFLGKAAAQVPKLGALAKLVAAAPRLVSLYFAGQMATGTAQQVPGLIDAKKEYDKALQAGDQERAGQILWNIKEQVAEGAVNSYLAYAAAHHARTGRPEPIAKAVSGALKETTQYAAEKGVEAIRNIPEVAKATVEGAKSAAGYTADKLGEVIGRTTDFDTAVKRASKVTPKQSEAFKEKLANVSEDLQAIANANPDISGPKEFAEKIRENNRNEEMKLQQAAGATKDSAEPVVENAEQRLRDRLDKFFNDNKGRFSNTDVEKAKQDVLDHFLQQDADGITRVPNLYESENVRQGLNDLTRPQFATNAQPTTSAFKAAAMEAANLTREMIDESYHNKGVEGVKEFRTKEANKISVADALEAAQKKADDMGQGGVFHSLMKKIGVPSSVIAIALGHPISGAAVGAAVLGDQISQNLTNPNVNIERALDIAGKNPNAVATGVTEIPNETPGPGAPDRSAPPTPAAPAPPSINHKLYSALSSYYGKIVGAVPFEQLESRFQADLQAAAEKGGIDPRQEQLLNKLNDAKAEQRLQMEEQQKVQADKAQADAEKIQKEQQKAADKAKAEAEKAAQEVEKEKAEKEKLGLNTNLSVPFDTDKELDLPANYAGLGYTGPRLRAHELGHQIMVDEFGHPTGDVISHLHDKIDKGAAAEARWDKSAFQDENGRWDQAKLLMGIPDILAIFHGGPIAEELVHGVPIEKNPGARGDIKRAKGILKELGFSPTEIGMMMKTAELKAREVLTSPGVKDIINRYTQAREAGLDEGLHMHPETIGSAVQEVRSAKSGGKNASDKNTNPGRTGEGSAEGKPGGKSKTANAAKGTARPAGEAGASPGNEAEKRLKSEINAGKKYFRVTGWHPETGIETDLGMVEAGSRKDAIQKSVKLGNPDLVRDAEEFKGDVQEGLKTELRSDERLPKVENLRVPPERTTGEYDEPIKQGGGVPGGIQKGDPEIDLPDLALFHDPATGSTLALPVDKVSAESVKAQLRKSRDMYLAAEDRKAAKVDYDKAFREHEGEQ